MSSRHYFQHPFILSPAISSPAPALPGGSQSVSRPAERHSLSSVPSYWRDVPWAPYQGGIGEAFWLGAWATSSGHCQHELFLLQAFQPISMEERSHRIEKILGHVYPQSCSFSQYPKLITIAQDKNKAHPVNQEFLSSLFTTTDRCKSTLLKMLHRSKYWPLTSFFTHS